MIKMIYSRAFSVLLKKPLRLWGISLLSTLLAGVFSIAFGIVPAIGFCVSLLLGVSMTMIYLAGYKGEEVKAPQLFACFKDGATMKRVLGGMLWMYMWIFIWGLIPIVGPIFALIRTYEYRLTPYILMTQPDVAPTDAYKKSSEMTKGYKAKMFWADVLVGLLIGAASLVLGLLTAIPYIGILFGIVAFVFSIAVAALQPLFLGLVQAAFYEEIKNPTPVAPKYQAPQYPQYPQGYQAPQGYQYPQQPQAPQGYQYPQQPQAPQGYQYQQPQAPQGYQYQQPQAPQGYQYPQGYQAPQAPQMPQAPTDIDRG